MKDFIKNLQSEANKTVRRIETSEYNMMARALAVSRVLEEVFIRLKAFVSENKFQDEDEEIHFFKEIKPQMFSKLIFYRKVYNIEMNRPLCGGDYYRDYLKNELKAIQVYIDKRLDFYRYYRSGATHLDQIYFLRGKKNNADQYLDCFYFERDPLFSTGADFRVAKIIANDMLREYLIEELVILSEMGNEPLPTVRLTWQNTKTDLCEQIYAWHSKGTFGAMPLIRLAKYIQKVFNIDLNDNLSRTFGEMRTRDNPTPYLDSLTEALLKRMKREKPKRSGYKGRVK